MMLNEMSKSLDEVNGRQRTLSDRIRNVDIAFRPRNLSLALPLD